MAVSDSPVMAAYKLKEAVFCGEKICEWRGLQNIHEWMTALYKKRTGHEFMDDFLLLTKEDLLALESQIRKKAVTSLVAQYSSPQDNMETGYNLDFVRSAIEAIDSGYKVMCYSYVRHPSSYLYGD